ncbi:MAG: alcohol dehydrogenase catalytic domain-containing protein [Clostridiales Family XIII bacterium]|jgi:L-iditol 2-dehydrogenase|nr:alcohol dehydrogenase catalytic domain-containing protein [Clostridiales Family XIII bacterium]
MKAGVFYGKDDVRYEDVPDLALEPGDRFDVLIKVKAGGICGSDIHYYNGEMPPDDFVGHVLGHELAGEVVEVGEGVTNVKVGDRVGVEPLIGCGVCDWCKAGEYHICPDLRHVGYYYSGGFGEYAKAPHDKVFKLPGSISYEAATLIDGYAVAIHALHKSALSVADFVVVFGAGPLGLCTAQAAVAAGARGVVIVDVIDEVLETARKAGIDEAWNSTKMDVVAEVLARTGGRGCDMVFETAGGNAPVIEPAVAMLRRGGYLGLLGIRDRMDFAAFPPQTKEITFDYIYSYAMWNYITEYEIALGLVARGDIDAEPLVTHVFPLSEIRQAFDTARDKRGSKAVKVVVKAE